MIRLEISRTLEAWEKRSPRIAEIIGLAVVDFIGRAEREERRPAEVLAPSPFGSIVVTEYRGITERVYKAKAAEETAGREEPQHD